MKNEIVNAYERMTPPQEAKERMMRNIQKKQNQRNGFHSASPTPAGRWAAIPAALALLMVITVGWKILIPGNSPAPIATNPTETGLPTQSVGVDVLRFDQLFPDVPQQYLPIVADYYSGLAENTDSTGWEKLGLNPAAYDNLDVIDGLGYALMDLDGNGKEELLITDGDQVYDLYTEVDGEIRELLGDRIDVQGKRNSIKLCQDNVLMVWQRSSGVDFLHWWRLGKDGLGEIALVCEETVYAGDDGKWYAGPNDKDSVLVSEEEAREIINGRNPVFVNYTSIYPERFADKLTGFLPAGYGPVIEKYIKAHEESWSPEEYMQNDISYVLSSKTSIWEYGYALIDLNGDGSSELVITDGENIYDVYMLMEDGSADHIISAGDRLRYQLCKDNVIGCWGSNSASSSFREYSRLLPGGSDSEIVMYLQFDVDTYHKIEGGSDKMVEISHEEADKIVSDYWHVEIPFQDFLREYLEVSEELKYPRTYGQMMREYMSEYSGVETMYVALSDVTGDGEEELLLGYPESFGHVFTMVDGQPEKLLSYGSDIGFTLCKNGVICCHDSDKPFGDYTFISLKNQEYQIIEHIVYNENLDSWTRGKDDDMKAITEDEFRAVMDFYGSVKLNMIPVMEFAFG